MTIDDTTYDTRLVKINHQSNEALIRTKGLDEFTEKLIYKSSFEINGQKSENFTEIDSYEKEKKNYDDFLAVTSIN